MIVFILQRKNVANTFKRFIRRLIILYDVTIFSGFSGLFMRITFAVLQVFRNYKICDFALHIIVTIISVSESFLRIFPVILSWMGAFFLNSLPIKGKVILSHLIIFYGKGPHFYLVNYIRSRLYFEVSSMNLTSINKALFFLEITS